MSQVDVQPVVGSINDMADVLVESAKELRNLAERMKNSGDLQYLAEVGSLLNNLFPALRFDQLLARTVRAYQKMEK